MMLRATRRYLILGAGLMVAAVAAIAIAIVSLREDALAETRADAGNMAVLMAAQIARSVQTVDIVIQEIKDGIDAHPAGSPADFVAHLRNETTHRLLRDKAARLPQADTLALVSAEGKVINYTRAWPIPDIDVTDRDYFRHFRDHDDRGLFLSRPVPNRSSGTWTIFLVRRVNTPSGGFAGLILGAMQLRYFADIFRQVSLPHDESFLLLHRDGTVIARHPDKIERAGEKLPANSPWYKVVAAGGGTFYSPGVFDGIARQVAVKPLADYPMVVNVAIKETVALAAWRRQAFAIGLGTAITVLLAVALGIALYRQMARLRESRLSLERRNLDLDRTARALEASEAVLSTTLDTMDQGLLLIDAGNHVALCSRRAREMLGLPAALMDQQPQHDEMIEWLAAHGDFAGTSPDIVAQIRAGAQARMAFTYERTRPNGLCIEVRTTPLPQGGVVRTLTDITERRRAEAQVRFLAHHDDLTRLVNRTLFNERLREATLRATYSERRFAVLYLDLDHFKAVNDESGHQAGDAVLTAAARRMRQAVRAEDTVARLGGDEFAIILAAADNEGIVAHTAARLVETIGAPYRVGGKRLTIGVSIGVALFPLHGRTAEQLLERADAALYRAKQSGRSTYRIAETLIETEIALV